MRGAGGRREEEGVQREPRAADDHARTRDAETHGHGARALREREQNGRRGVGSVLMGVYERDHEQMGKRHEWVEGMGDKGERDQTHIEKSSSKAGNQHENRVTKNPCKKYA